MFLAQGGGPKMDFEVEIIELKRRVGDLEGAVSVLSGNMGSIHPELVQLKQLTSQNFDKMDVLMGRFVQRLDTMNSQVWSLRDDLPDLMSGIFKSQVD
jgi:hypothetical protein